MHIVKNELKDNQLIDLCLSGGELGYTGLYHRYADSIFNSILRLVQDVAEAEDLLQEVFVTVFSDREKLGKLDNFEAWTRRLAINLSISHLRKRKMVFVDIESLRGEDCLPEVEEVDWSDIQVAAVDRAIQALPHTARTVLNLYLFEGVRQEEIAQLLGMTHTAVRSQYHRAKQKIEKAVHPKSEERSYGR